MKEEKEYGEIQIPKDIYNELKEMIDLGMTKGKTVDEAITEIIEEYFLNQEKQIYKHIYMNWKLLI